MQDAIYHLRIKKDYAAAVIEDLRILDAVEFVEEDFMVPDEQRAEVRRRLQALKDAPETAVTKEEAERRLNRRPHASL